MANIIPNAGNKLLVMGDLYFSSNYDVTSSTIPTLTPTNQLAVKGALDAYSYSTVGHIKEFSISHSLENEEIIRAGNCGVGELAKLVEKTPTISFTWLDVNNREVFDKMLGLDRLSVAATPVVGAVQTITNPTAYNKFIKIVNQNGDLSPVVVTAVSGSVDGSIDTTGYDVIQNELGETGIIFLS
jgi:hypothetical protein